MSRGAPPWKHPAAIDRCCCRRPSASSGTAPASTSTPRSGRPGTPGPCSRRSRRPGYSAATATPRPWPTRALLATLGARVIVEQASFRQLPEIHRRHGGEPFAGALFDLGLSSRQLDDPERGMSFMAEGPLDLRMDPGSGTSAAEALKLVGERELAEMLRRHGEVPRAAHLARAISGAARAGRLETTSALVATVERCLGGRAHPRRLAQVFQALRRWVNEEAEELEAALSWLPAAMRPGGVVVTI